MLNVFINILILLSISIGIPIVIVGGLSLFKFKISKQIQTYLYAFTAGLIIILGTVGFLSEAISHAKDNFLNSNNNHAALKLQDTLTIIGVVGGGSILGIIIALLSRVIFTKLSNKKGDLHNEHLDHNHHEFLFNPSDIDNKAMKWIPILLLLGHRLVDGIVLGFMANTIDGGIANFENWGMIITFALHLIPTTIIIYLIQLDIQNNNRLKSFLITFAILVLMIPFTLIGGFLINSIQTIWWLMPLFYAISGSLMTIASVFEIIPEFIHNRNANLKQWVYTTLFLGSGIVISILLITIHSH